MTIYDGVEHQEVRFHGGFSNYSNATMFLKHFRRAFGRNLAKKDAVVILDWKCGYTWPATLKVRIDRRLAGTVPPDDTAAVYTNSGRHYLSVYSYFLFYPFRKLGGCHIDIKANTYQRFRVTIHPVVRSREKWLYLIYCLVFVFVPRPDARSVRYLDVILTDEGPLRGSFAVGTD